MGTRKTPPTGTSGERAILDAFARDGLAPHRWSDSPGDVYAAHSPLSQGAVRLRGSIVFRLPETGEEIARRPGDRLDSRPGTMHAALVGPDGVPCIEAACG